MFKDLLSKVLAGLVLLLLIISTSLYVSGNFKESKITSLNKELSEFQNRNSVLQNRLENCQSTFKAAMDGFQTQNDVIEIVKSNEQKTLEQLSNKINSSLGGTNDSKNNNGDDLDPDTIRLLSDFCSKVRGSDCPNP